MSQVKEFDLNQMAPLRNASQMISQYLYQKIESYLEPLNALFAPKRVLGEYLEGFSRESVRGAEKNFAILADRYAKVCNATFHIPGKLKSPVPAIRNKLKIYPWEYPYQIGGDPAQTITISSPVKWILTYDYPYTLSNVLKANRKGEKLQLEETRQFVINTVTLWLLMSKEAGLKQILADLRYPVSEDTSSVSGDLPFIVISSSIQSFIPQDDLIQTVTQLSGKPVFEELVDLESVDSITDPLAEKLKALVSGS